MVNNTYRLIIGGLRCDYNLKGYLINEHVGHCVIEVTLKLTYTSNDFLLMLLTESASILQEQPKTLLSIWLPHIHKTYQEGEPTIEFFS